MRSLSVTLFVLLPLVAVSQPRGRHYVKDRAVVISVVNAEEIAQTGLSDLDAALAFGVNGLRVGSASDGSRIKIRGVETVQGDPIRGHYSSLSDAQGVHLVSEPIQRFEHLSISSDEGGPHALNLSTHPAGVLDVRPGQTTVIDYWEECTTLQVNVRYDLEGSTYNLEGVECKETGIVRLECPSYVDAEPSFITAVFGSSPDPANLRLGLAGNEGTPRVLIENIDQVEWEVIEDGLNRINAEVAFGDYEDDFVWADGTAADIPESVTRVLTDEQRLLSLSAEYEYGSEVSSCIVERKTDLAFPSGNRERDEELFALSIRLSYNTEFEKVSFGAMGRGPVPIGMPLFGELGIGSLDDRLQLNLDVLCKTEVQDLFTLFWGGGLHAQRYSAGDASEIELGPGLSASAVRSVAGPIEVGVDASLSRLYGSTVPEFGVRVGYRFGGGRGGL